MDCTTLHYIFYSCGLFLLFVSFFFCHYKKKLYEECLYINMTNVGSLFLNKPHVNTDTVCTLTMFQV